MKPLTKNQLQQINQPYNSFMFTVNPNKFLFTEVTIMIIPFITRVYIRYGNIVMTMYWKILDKDIMPVGLNDPLSIFFKEFYSNFSCLKLSHHLQTPYINGLNYNHQIY